MACVCLGGNQLRSSRGQLTNHASAPCPMASSYANSCITRDFMVGEKLRAVWQPRLEQVKRHEAQKGYQRPSRRVCCCLFVLLVWFFLFVCFFCFFVPLF